MLLTKMLLVTGVLGAIGLGSPSASSDAAPSPASSTSPSPALTRLVDRLVRDGAPGALAVVRTPSGLHRARSGLARLRPRVPMASDDRFRVASLTKTFVSTIVLQLIDEGKLHLDDPVERWLPGLVPNGSAITIRDLLDHASGLFDYTDDKPFVRSVIARPGRVWAPSKLVAIATDHLALFPPGDDWSYSNTNYIVLGLVVEAATGTTINSQLSRRLFRPLRLRATSFPSDTRVDGAHADGYIGHATLGRLHSLVDATTVVSPSVFWTAGGIVSNAADLTRFYAALLGGRLLPPRMLAAMETPAPYSEYGLGLLITDTECGRAYGHEGIGTGYRTIVYARPGGTRIALVMVNVDETHIPQSELEAAAETAFCSS
jgi:D-alanyl-D-alanine carboxypeptidase